MINLSTIKTTIEHEGDVWQIADVIRVADGHALCSLVSTTRKRETIKGRVVKRTIADWIPIASLFEAMEAA